MAKTASKSKTSGAGAGKAALAKGSAKKSAAPRRSGASRSKR